MGFKAIKQQSQQPQYCDYVQNKIDIARDNNSVYELVDQDNRIQKLYSDSTLKPVDKIRSIARVKRQDDGAECLVVTKDVAFVDKITGLQKDRYTEKEGLVELPLKITNEEGVVEDSQVRLEYIIPFTKEKVMEYVRKAGSRGVKLRFYDGAETGSRLPSRTQVVGNLDYFVNATWEELLMGKEMGLVSSMVNKIDDVRKNMGINYLATATTTAINPQQETNKKEEQNIIIGNGEQKQEVVDGNNGQGTKKQGRGRPSIQKEQSPSSSTTTATAASSTVENIPDGIKLKVANSPDQKD